MSDKNRTILIVGGKLQGMEACYLAKKAGITTILVDQNPDAPAQYLCDTFLCQDLFEKGPEVTQAFLDADMILPALENDEVLSWLDRDSKAQGYTLAFDWEAYQLSSSKLRSDQLFQQLGIPAPAYFPAGRFPYIGKPISDSGSHGVLFLDTRDKLQSALDRQEPMIIQEYLTGPSYSIEIIGKPGNYRTYEITQIHMDDVYDCNRVTAPCGLPKKVEDGFRKMAETIAEEIHLHGIMDLEVIDHRGVLKILEIDARIPSQTPAAVLHSSGMNLLEELYDLFCTGSFQTPQQRQGKFVSYEHHLVDGGNIQGLGEHIMVEGAPLRYMPGFLGADEAMTDYEPGKTLWRGTFINTAGSKIDITGKRSRMLNKISELDLEKHSELDLEEHSELD